MFNIKIFNTDSNEEIIINVSSIEACVAVSVSLIEMLCDVTDSKACSSMIEDDLLSGRYVYLSFFGRIDYIIQID